MIPRISAAQFAGVVGVVVAKAKVSAFPMDEAVPMLLPLARKAFQKWPQMNSIMTPEELANECFIQFVEKAYLDKYDPSRTNKPYFIWIAVMRKAIDILRHSDHVVKLISDKITKDEFETSIYDLTPDTNNHDPIGQIVMNEALLMLSKKDPLKRTFEHEGRNIWFSEYWVFVLHLRGYENKELANLFRVTAATIGNYLKSSQRKLQDWYLVD